MENSWVNKLGNFMEYRLTFFCDVEGKVICSEGERFERGGLSRILKV